MPEALAAVGVGGFDDLHEVGEELAGHVLVGGADALAVVRQFQRHTQHAGAEKRHPRGAVGLLEMGAVGQLHVAVYDADVVQPEEAAGEDAVALFILAIDPPGEVEQQLLKDAGEEFPVLHATALGVYLIHAPRGPRMDGRVHVGEVELVGRHLAVGVEIPFAQQQGDLLLGVGGVYPRQRDGVESEVPRGEPRVFPFVRHGDDIAGEEVLPFLVGALFRDRLRQRHEAVAEQPFLHAVVVELLGPKQPGVGLEADLAGFGIKAAGEDAVVVGLALGGAGGDDFIEAVEGIAARQSGLAEAEAHGGGLPWLKCQDVVRRGFGAARAGAQRLVVAPDHAVVKGVFEMDAGGRVFEAAEEVGLVVGEKKPAAARGVGGIEVEAVIPQRLAFEQQPVRIFLTDDRLFRTGDVIRSPRPDIAKPNLRQQVERGRVRGAVGDRVADEYILRA